MTVRNPLPAAHPPAVTARVGGMFHAPAVPRPSTAAPGASRRMAPHARAFRRPSPGVRHTAPFRSSGGSPGAPWTARATLATGPAMAGVSVGTVPGPCAAPKRRPGPRPLDRVRRLIAPDPASGASAVGAANSGHRG